VREFPSVDPPVITVTTNYTGANADIIESQITEILEESINGIAGIRSLTSVSSDGRSSITVEFDLDVDLEAAANDVRDRVSRSRAQPAAGRRPTDRGQERCGCGNPILSHDDPERSSATLLEL
jgi:multidrug efflux pump subunit AcrB